MAERSLQISVRSEAGSCFDRRGLNFGCGLAFMWWSRAAMQHTVDDTTSGEGSLMLPVPLGYRPFDPLT
jgi:hypothetical protein